MDNMGNLFGHLVDDLDYERGEFFKTKDRFGIEVEVEGVDIGRRVPDNFGKYWTIKGDGSLRNNGAELVLVQPLFGVDLEKAFESLKEWFRQQEHVHATERCSIHVHMDIRDMSLDEFKSFLLVYLSLEKLIYALSGKRNDNIFCIPLQESYNMLSQSRKIFSQKEGRSGIRDGVNTEKYMGLNLGAIRKFGSVEFRHHSGTTDTDEIRHWVKTIQYLKNYSRNVKIPFKDFPTFVSEYGLERFVADALGEQYVDALYEGFNNDLLEGIRFAQMVIHQDHLDVAERSFYRARNKSNDLKNMFVKKEGDKK